VESGGKIYDSGIDIIVDGAIQSVTGVGHAWLHLAALCRATTLGSIPKAICLDESLHPWELRLCNQYTNIFNDNRIVCLNSESPSTAFAEHSLVNTMDNVTCSV